MANDSILRPYNFRKERIFNYSQIWVVDDQDFVKYYAYLYGRGLMCVFVAIKTWCGETGDVLFYGKGTETKVIPWEEVVEDVLDSGGDCL